MGNVRAALGKVGEIALEPVPDCERIRELQGQIGAHPDVLAALAREKESRFSGDGTAAAVCNACWYPERCICVLNAAGGAVNLRRQAGRIRGDAGACQAVSKVTGDDRNE